MKTLPVALLSTVLFTTGAMAEDVTRECIFTGHVHNNDTAGASNEVRVTFHNAENGENAPCRMQKSKTRARIQFKANAEDQLHALPDGSPVQYRYQRKNGKDQWQLMNAGNKI